MLLSLQTFLYVKNMLLGSVVLLSITRNLAQCGSVIELHDSFKVGRWNGGRRRMKDRASCLGPHPSADLVYEGGGESADRVRNGIGGGWDWLLVSLLIHSALVTCYMTL